MSVATRQTYGPHASGAVYLHSCPNRASCQERPISCIQSSRVINRPTASQAASRTMASHDSKTDLYGGFVLGVATLAALILANSPLATQYEALLQATGEIRIGSLAPSQTLEHWINDGLMAVFFLLMGLEIKREVMEGALASRRGATLPAVAAFGGFVVPAVIYAAINWHHGAALRRWDNPF